MAEDGDQLARLAWDNGKPIVQYFMDQLEDAISKRALCGYWNVQLSITGRWINDELNVDRIVKVLREGDLFCSGICIGDGATLMDVWWGSKHRYYYDVTHSDARRIVIDLSLASDGYSVKTTTIPYMTYRSSQGRRPAVAIVGASGIIGKSILDNLSDRMAAAYEFRCVTSRLARMPEMREQYSRFNWFYADPLKDDGLHLVSLALQGVTTILYIVSKGNIVSNSRALHATRVIDAAVRAQAKHFITVGVDGSEDKAHNWYAVDHARIEQYVEFKGLSFTHVRPSLFTEHLFKFAQSVKLDNLLSLQLGSEGSLPLISAQDVGLFCASLFRDLSSHANKSYRVTGPAGLSGDQIASQLSAVLRKKVTYSSGDWGDTISSFGTSMSDWEASRFAQWLSMIAEGAAVQQPSDDFQSVVGREATTLVNWITKHQARFATPRPRVLILGAQFIATGIAKLLIDHPIDVRASVRSEKIKSVLEQEFPIVDWIVFDGLDANSCASAFKGVTTVFASPLTGKSRADRSTWVQNVDQASTKANVRHFVLALACNATNTPHYAESQSFAEVLEKSQKRFTQISYPVITRALFTRASASVRSSKQLRLQLGETGAVAPISSADLCEFATLILANVEDHCGKKYTLTGPSVVTGNEIAKSISGATGATIEYDPLTAEQHMESLKLTKIPSWISNLWVETMSSFEKGECSAVTNDFRNVVGRDPISVDDWIQENAQEFRSEPEFSPQFLYHNTFPESAVAYVEHGPDGWKDTSWSQYRGEAISVGKALIASGVAPGDRICICGPNSSRWTTAYMGASLVGAVPSGIYATSSAEEIAYILNHSEAKVLFVHNSTVESKVVLEDTVLSKLVVMHGGVGKESGMSFSWSDFVGSGAATADVEVESRCAALTPEDLCTLIYTSGTTGPPKAVQLTHANVSWATRAIVEVCPDGTFTSDGARGLSYLPLSHIAEQLFSIHLHVYAGHKMWFCQGREQFVANLKQCQPTYLFGVPRIWEKFHAALSSKIPAGVPASALPDANKQGMFAALGLSQCKLAVTGAAPISKHILEFFGDLGMPIYEVYGQSEDCGATSLNLPGAARVGSVGRPFSTLEVRIAEDGEVLVRGPSVFTGYYRNAEATASTLDSDGFLHSGDLGRLDEDGYLWITGRKKDLIITSGGKNISPSYIELKLTNHPLIESAVVCGDARKYLTALLTLNQEAVAAAGDKAEIRDAVEAHVDSVNATLAKVETIKKFKIVTGGFDPSLLTATLKIKRGKVLQAHAADIDAMYVVMPTIGLPPPQPTLVVFGGSGALGTSILSAMLNEQSALQKYVIKATTRDADKLANLRSNFPGVEWIVADYADSGTLDAAFRDATKAIFILGEFSDGREEQTSALVEAAIRSQHAKEIMFVSVVGADKSSSSIQREYLSCENKIKSSGISSTVVRMPFRNENLIPASPQIKGGNMFLQLGSATVAPLSLADAARFIGAATMSGEFSGATVSLSGPQLLSGEEMAKTLTSVLGYEVGYKAIDSEATKKGLSHRVPRAQLESLVEQFDALSKGDGSLMTEFPQQRSSFQDWVEDNKSHFQRAESTQPFPGIPVRGDSLPTEGAIKGQLGANKEELFSKTAVSQGAINAVIFEESLPEDDEVQVSPRPVIGRARADAHSDTKIPILIIDGSSPIGKQTVTHLGSHVDIFDVRATVGSAGQLHEMAKEFPGVKWLECDFSDGRSVDMALTGVQRVYFIDLDTSQAHIVATAAHKHNVQLVINFSENPVIGAIVNKADIPSVVHISAPHVMEIFLEQTDSIRKGSLYHALGEQASISPVSRSDVGAFAGHLLTASELPQGGKYRLTGADVTGESIANTFTSVLGYEITYSSSGDPSKKHGGVSPDFEAILGRPAQTLTQWVQQHRDAFLPAIPVADNKPLLVINGIGGLSGGLDTHSIFHKGSPNASTVQILSSLSKLLPQAAAKSTVVVIPTTDPIFESAIRSILTSRGAEEVAVVPAPVASMYSVCESVDGDVDEFENGICIDTTSLVVFSDEVQTFAIAVHNGVSLHDTKVWKPFGRKDIVSFLKRTLEGNKKFDELKTSSPETVDEVLDGIINSTSYVSEHFITEMQEGGYSGGSGPLDGWTKSPTAKEGTLTDYKLGVEVFFVTEAFFQPSLAELDEESMVPLPEMLKECLDKAPQNLRTSLAENVVLCGSNSLVKGLSNRLFKEGNVLIKEDLDINQAEPLSEWKGAKFMIEKKQLGPYLGKKTEEKQKEQEKPRAEVKKLEQKKVAPKPVKKKEPVKKQPANKKAPAKKAEAPTKKCKSCGEHKVRQFFSKNQWGKGEVRRCAACIKGSN